MIEKLKFLLSVYQHSLDADTQQQLLDQLRTMPEEAVLRALDEYPLHAENNFFSYHLIIKLVKDFSLNDFTAVEAFDKISVLINTYGRTYQGQFPDLIEKTINQMGGWQNICSSEYPIRNTFIKIYNELRAEKAVKYLYEYQNSQ